MIYEPAEDSELIKKYVKKFAWGRVLDMGTGSGIQAITASKRKKVNGVLAVDINKKAVELVRKKGIRTKVSDLFSNVSRKFDTIIFNPPYLPFDKREDGESQLATTGGKKGYEALEKFLNQVNGYLTEKGIVLIVFSSLTKKERVDEIIGRNLLKGELLEKQHIHFEDLFVYKIIKSKVLQELEKKGVSEIKYLAKGKRGRVFTGVYRRKKVAIKIKRTSSLAQGRMKNEVKWLKVLNRKGIGPKLLFYGRDYLSYRFVEGVFFVDYNNKKKLVPKILKQCFEMDKLGVNKEEMHRPLKHILVDGKGKVTMIDFERCYATKKPHNVTQFGVFLIRLKLVKKGMKEALKEYKMKMNEKNFKKILQLV